METDGCILVCVTTQASCRRLINAGAALAKKEGLKLLVLSVFPTNSALAPQLEILGELDRCAKEHDAEMLLFYNDLPFAVAASVAKKYKAKNIVTGFCENGVSPFITSLHTVLPDIPISMVDTDEKIFSIIPPVKKQYDKLTIS